MNIPREVYRAAFLEYLRKGTPISWSLKQWQPTNERPTRRYIWRTQRDSDVRSRHAQRDGRIIEWDNPPEGGHPGEDYGCRCWAQPLELDPTNELILDAYQEDNPDRQADMMIDAANQLDKQNKNECQRIYNNIVRTLWILGELAETAQEIETQIHALHRQIAQSQTQFAIDAATAAAGALTGPLGKFYRIARNGGPIASAIRSLDKTEILQAAGSVFDSANLIASGVQIARQHNAMNDLVDNAAQIASSAQGALDDLQTQVQNFFASSCELRTDLSR